MRFQVRFTEEARDDLQRLYDFALQPERGGWDLAERMLDAVATASSRSGLTTRPITRGTSRAFMSLIVTQR